MKERKILNVIDTSTPSTLDSRISLTLPSGSRKPRVCVRVCVSYCRIYMRRWRRSARENTTHNYREKELLVAGKVCVVLCIIDIRGHPQLDVRVCTCVCTQTKRTYKRKKSLDKREKKEFQEHLIQFIRNLPVERRQKWENKRGESSHVIPGRLLPPTTHNPPEKEERKKKKSFLPLLLFHVMPVSHVIRAHSLNVRNKTSEKETKQTHTKVSRPVSYTVQF